MPKKNGRIFSLDRKLKITQNYINKTFDQLKTLKKFDQVIKHNFDQTPKLLQNFDQLIRSSEIRSSGQFPFNLIEIKTKLN